MPNEPANAEEHFRTLKRLVRLEEAEENEEIREEFLKLSPQEREARGKVLLGLVLTELHFSPAEHPLATLKKRDGSTFPLFSLEMGDMVALVPERRADADFPTATVYERTPESVTIAFGGPPPDWLDEGGTFQLHKSVNRVTYKRMLEALDAVEQTRNTRLAAFRDVALGFRKAVMRDDAPSRIEWLDEGLNASQRRAVVSALSNKDVALVHGPPGTGKTTVLVEIIRQAVKAGESVFVTAPSNTACDNLLERLAGKGMMALRLGHPARITTSLREHTLDFRLALHPLAKAASEMRSELTRLRNRLDRYRDRRSPGREAERGLREEIANLRDEISRLRTRTFQAVMRETEVFVGTLAGIQDRAVRERPFDLLVMDEATQATEPMSWIAMQRAGRVVMAGDHFQLPPTVRSKEAEAQGLGVTLFERFYARLNDDSKTLLDRQYRMNRIIMGFSSRRFYKNLLVADESVSEQTLAGLPGVRRLSGRQAGDADTESPLVFFDTSGKGFEEMLEAGSDSRYNPEEADLVLAQLKKYLDAGVKPADIAVISPYSAQVRYLTSRLPVRQAGTPPEAAVEIDSVDGFQGREKELVIVSLVRSNVEGEMGFLTDTRRMNVAMTRARRKLVVFGDGATLASIEFYRDFMKYAEECGAHRSAWELA